MKFENGYRVFQNVLEIYIEHRLYIDGIQV